MMSVIALPIFAQQTRYTEFKELAKTDINLRPEYGNVKKNEGYLAADQKFIDVEVKQSGTRKKASENGKAWI